MMKDSIRVAVNKQIRHEQSNAHAYLAVALYFGRLDLPGLEAFMAAQAGDERGHARRLIRHVTDRGAQVELGTIPAPKTEFSSPLEAVRAVWDMERVTTEAIHRLYELARAEADHALEVALHWFIKEQVEEECWAGRLVAQMERFHEHPAQLFMFDTEWGKPAMRANGTRACTERKHL